MGPPGPPNFHVIRRNQGKQEPPPRLEVSAHFSHFEQSYPLKLLIQFLSREDQLCGPAVGAMVRVVTVCRCSKKRGDLRGREPIAGLDGRFAGNRVQHVVEQVAAIGGCPPPETSRSSKAW